MRALVLVLLLTACSAPSPSLATRSATPDPGVLAVTALLDLSGPRASLGTQQRNALQLWVDERRGDGSVPVKLRMVDVAGSDAKVFIELRRAAVEEPAQAVIVGAPVTYDDTLDRAIDVAAMPVLFTLPLALDPVTRPGGRWAFALAPSLGAIAEHEVDDALGRGALVPSVVLTAPADRIDRMASALAAELARRKIDGATPVALASDGTVPPMVRTSLSVLRSVHCFVAIATCSAVAQTAQSSGAPTVFYLPYETTPQDLSDRKELSARAVVPSTWTILRPEAVGLGPVDHVRQTFARAYADRSGPPGAQAAVAHDALTLIAAAAGRGGPGDRRAVRDALEATTMPLVATTYTFRADRHAGSNASDVTYVRWNGSQLARAVFGPP